MKKIAVALFVLLLFGCGASVMSVQNGDEAKRAKVCKQRCDKKHYNITIIRVDGKIEKYKISIVSLDDKVACECRF
jgi:uncharacterized protein YceK